MQQEITASYMIDVPTALTGLQWSRRHNGIFRLGGILLFVCMALIVADKSGLGFDSLFAQAAAIIGVSTSLYALLTWIERRQLIQNIRQWPTFGQTVSFTFTDEGMRTVADPSHGFTAWKHVLFSASAPEGGLIFTQPDAFQWLPKTAFTSEADYNRFLDLLAAKTKHSKLG